MAENGTDMSTHVQAYCGGIGYRYVAGHCARFPWNDFSKSDEASEVVFEIQPSNGWGGDAMGIRLLNALDEFVNKGSRASANDGSVFVEHIDSPQGGYFAFSVAGKRLFMLEARRNWKGEELLNYLRQVVSEYLKS